MEKYYVRTRFHKHILFRSLSAAKRFCRLFSFLCYREFNSLFVIRIHNMDCNKDYESFYKLNGMTVSDCRDHLYQFAEYITLYLSADCEDIYMESLEVEIEDDAYFYVFDNTMVYGMKYSDEVRTIPSNFFIGKKKYTEDKYVVTDISVLDGVCCTDPLDLFDTSKDIFLCNLCFSFQYNDYVGYPDSSIPACLID